MALLSILIFPISLFGSIFFVFSQAIKEEENANAKKEFKVCLLEQIHQMVGNDLTGRTKEILQVDNYYIRLKKYNDLSFEDSCKSRV